MPKLVASYESGYTLVELLVVLAIMAIIAVGTFVTSRGFSQDQAVVRAMGQVQSLIKLAQSNANSNLKCNGVPSSHWYVEFDSIQTQNQIQKTQVYLKCQVYDIPQAQQCISTCGGNGQACCNTSGQTSNFGCFNDSSTHCRGGLECDGANSIGFCRPPQSASSILQNTLSLEGVKVSSITGSAANCSTNLLSSLSSPSVIISFAPLYGNVEFGGADSCIAISNFMTIAITNSSNVASSKSFNISKGGAIDVAQ